MDTQNVYIDMDGALATDDPQGQRKVDGSGMLRPGPGEPDLPVQPNFTRMKVTFEFKRQLEDPVVDANPKLSAEERKEQVPVFAFSSSLRRLITGRDMYTKPPLLYVRAVKRRLTFSTNSAINHGLTPLP